MDPRLLCLSQTTGYVIQALRGFNEPSCACQTTAETARCARVPGPYLAKVIQALARKGMVKARRGRGGGVFLARPPDDITLQNLIEAVKGPDRIGDCLLNLHGCSTERVCPTHPFWRRIRDGIPAALRRTTRAAVIAFKRNKVAPHGPTRRLRTCREKWAC